MNAHDKITLRNAMENPAWLMVYAGNPERNIDVSMTYADLFAIYQWVKSLPQKEPSKVKAIPRRKRVNRFE